MQLIIKAEWEQIDPGFSDVEVLKIAGLGARVYDRGDYWAWEIYKDQFAVPDLYDGSADSQEEARAAAEAWIRNYFSKEGQS